ncbi:unnamed protein product [Candidula unifasciata]|uniref:G-protein coupled receptors family 1 profile domain-containing protein n=1 Tax=Candidula unifasciata TaxID=100452 RepID=A0A8S3ZJ04_9EUPU|nr:unnamed protein product [Candidula unifasciata]
MLFVTPAISVVGIVGNVCSILVLAKQNWRKCSNILLLGLAVSDVMYLFGFNNIPKIIYTVFGKQSFLYSRYSSTVLFIFSEVCLIIDYSSGLISLTLPMLITIERLVTRTFIAVSGVFIFWYGNFIYTVFWFELGDKYDISVNKTVFVIVRSALFRQDRPTVYQIEEVWAYMSMRIPAVFTFIGCIVIGVKIKMASIKRRQLTGKQAKGSMNRTTKTLLAVCGVYTVTCAIASLPVVIPQYVSYSISEDSTTNICQVTYHIISTVVCVNSSCNFVIYIVFNKNFRVAYKALFIKGSKNNIAIRKR